MTDPKRHRATCPTCGYVADRAKREAAEHVLAQHVAYTHPEKQADGLLDDPIDELAADAQRTRTSDLDDAPRPQGFDPACLFLLDLNYGNLFERVSARAGDDRLWRCKGCGREVTLPKREAHWKNHRRTRGRATTKGAPNMKTGTKTVAIEVLKRAGTPLHVKEITKRIIATGKTGLGKGGSTPEATVAAMFSVAAKKPDAPFVKTAPSTYGLAGAGASGAKAPGKAKGTAAKSTKAKPAKPPLSELTNRALKVLIDDETATKSARGKAAAELASRTDLVDDLLAGAKPVEVEPDPKPESAKKIRSRKKTAAATK